MQASELKISGAFEFTPRTFPDDRGVFVAPFQSAAFEAAVGHSLRLRQTNHSVSRRGVVRGIHFADVPPSQAKYVFCPRGSMLDFVIDVRVGSPTFGQWDTVLLTDSICNAVYIPEGLGHAMVALEDDTTMSYLCSEGFNPGAEHGIDPLDATLALPWPSDLELVLSEKDRTAPSLESALASGLLPRYEDCLAFYATLKG
ncbi:dTDP-4-dehydrorhamnose 3,5-epimerase [Lentzea sp. NBRC 105346]|uniref:dTDP-4-dehydrorhamnose 3,5-epimerase family protein n=1 Tax=Lentzea sp. NBRC 105346 TaxID=3032205 RepID=UPI0024A2E1E3|nr:dTDP-4-dehydrorhamnose 3,5-epimerase family protein [Lentzea sp. NBRC 105346]GLZ29889.1 dTDP-4-dehydrorhamnose 3,5-epimerase [Lentzea sp. NBRC 105346]